MDGFRSLREGERVEFDLEISDDGRAKAMNVTGPGGEPPEVEFFFPVFIFKAKSKWQSQNPSLGR